jgi:glucokinase
MNGNDPLCMKVVTKFTEIFANECGNVAIKTLPYGGVYVMGGVANGIKDHLTGNPQFMEVFKQRGRLSGLMDSFKVYVVNPDIEVGLLGAQEMARRQMIQTI